MHGSISLEGKVKGQGRSPGGIVSVLDGTGDWSLSKSRLVGTNPGGFSESIGGVDDAAKLEGVISASLHKGVWPFEPVRSKWAVQSGLLKLNPGEVKSEVAAGQVSGLANLTNGKLTADWNVRVTGVKDAPDYQVKLEGPMGKLVRSHDTSSLRSFLVVRVLQESMRKLEDLQREQERLFQEREKAKEEAAASPTVAGENTAQKGEDAAAEEAAPTPQKLDEDTAEKAKQAEAKEQAEAKVKEEAEAKTQAEAKEKKEAEAKKQAEAEQAAKRAAAKKEEERLAAEAAARKELERLAAEAAAREKAEAEAAEKLAREIAAREAAEAKEAELERQKKEKAAQLAARQLKAKQAREAARAVAEAEALRAAQQREGADREAIGLQQLRRSNRAKDDNR